MTPLAGGVVRIGKEWSVIKSSGPDGLVIWGKFTDETPKFEVLDPYTAKGAQSSRPSAGSPNREG